MEDFKKALEGTLGRKHIDNIVDQVEIFGEHMTLESMAKDLDTISYEVLCLISKRVPRVYVQDGQVKELL